MTPEQRDRLRELAGAIRRRERRRFFREYSLAPAFGGSSKLYWWHRLFAKERTVRDIMQEPRNDR